MGKKITQLNVGVIPYTGTEEVAMVDEAQTRRASLSSITNYLSSAKYCTGSTVDRPIATPLGNNFFQTTQSTVGDLSATGRLFVGESVVSSGTLASVVGGTGNSATGGCSVVGGQQNTANQANTNVGGGRSNFACGVCSTVGGGFSNKAGAVQP